MTTENDEKHEDQFEDFDEKDWENFMNNESYKHGMVDLEFDEETNRIQKMTESERIALGYVGTDYGTKKRINSEINGIVSLDID